MEISLPTQATQDARKEQTDRTIYIGNIPSDINENELIQLFQTCGQINLVKIASESNKTIVNDISAKYAFIEFADLSGVSKAFELNGIPIRGNLIKIGHSQGPIVMSTTNRVIDLRPKQLSLAEEAEKQADDEIQRQLDEQMNAIMAKYSNQTEETPKDEKLDDSKSKEEKKRSPTPSRERRSRRRSDSRERRSRRRSDSRDRRRRRDRSDSRDRRRRRDRSDSHYRRSHRRSDSRDRRSRRRSDSRDRSRRRSDSRDRSHRRH